MFKEPSMTRPPFEIDGPYKAKRNKTPQIIAAAILAVVLVIVLSL
jgi:hypothetical protein